MYEEFFEMSNTPFLNSIPTDAMYLSDSHMEVLGRLEYAASKRLFAVLTAGPGCGKSSIARKFSETLNRDKYTLLYVSDSMLTPRWFYKGLLDGLGIEAKFYRGDAKRQLHKQLEVIREVHHKNVVVIVDEAHLLEKETFEEIRFMLNFQMDSMTPMSLVLVGQNELWEKLKLQRYEAIRQRIDLTCELPLFDRVQTGEYIASHLRYASGKSDIFTDEALSSIYKHSAGRARLVNKICSHCLMNASQKGKRLIDDHMVKNVVDCEMSKAGMP
jgi:type II secretory pathway predicted ATPase ExeA